MKKILPILILVFGMLQVHAGEVVEVDVHGMTCAFCVYAVQRNLNKLPDVEKAEVSLKLKQVRVHGKEAGLDLERVRQAIVDSGFTPIAVRTINDGK